MSIFRDLANGLGTLIGVLVKTTTDVIAEIKSSYLAYQRQGGPTKDVAKRAADLKKDRLREVNDEIMALRNRRMSSGTLSDLERRRWENLREERENLLGEVNRAKEVRAAEKIIETEEHIEKVNIDVETTHMFQYNAFADTLGKQCKCGRRMKLQWKRQLPVAEPKDFFWGCTGWYEVQPNGARACTNTEQLTKNDYGLMTDTTQPEFSVTAEEFGLILTDARTEKLIVERVEDLRSDLSNARKGVELVTCPVHGENMVLRPNKNAIGLLDQYF